ADDVDGVLIAEQLLFDLPFRKRCHSEQQPRLVTIAHGALTLGIGAPDAAPASRTKSSLPASLASASALASDGFRSATVTGIVWLEASKPDALPTSSTSRLRAMARVCDWPLALV